jgi:transcriptional regulator GlxA family with amidase domain
VGVLAYDGCLGTEVFGIVDLLLFANRLAAPADDPFRVTVVAREASEVVTAGGVTLRAETWHQQFDLLIVPGFDVRSPRHVDWALDRWRPEIARIASAADAGIPVASVCVGAFLLGEAGLLDGRTATTSWLFAGELRRRYRRAVVDGDLMIASDGIVTTTAAFSAVHDLALRIIQAHGGDNLARRVARLSLVADNRNSQAPYVDDELLEPTADALSQSAKAWLIRHLAEPYDLAVLAQSFHVSTRTMLRRFGNETGQSPLDFLRQARVNAAKRLLESPDHTVTSAMQHVGYADLASFRRLFTEQVGMTPAAYRRQFRAPARRLLPAVVRGVRRRLTSARRRCLQMEEGRGGAGRADLPGGGQGWRVAQRYPVQPRGLPPRLPALPGPVGPENMLHRARQSRQLVQLQQRPRIQRLPPGLRQRLAGGRGRQILLRPGQPGRQFPPPGAGDKPVPPDQQDPILIVQHRGQDDRRPTQHVVLKALPARQFDRRQRHPEPRRPQHGVLALDPPFRHARPPRHHPCVMSMTAHPRVAADLGRIDPGRTG